jgi:hypothetical protein
LKQEGQREEFSNNYQEKEEYAPTLHIILVVFLPPEGIAIHKV